MPEKHKIAIIDDAIDAEMIAEFMAKGNYNYSDSLSDFSIAYHYAPYDKNETHGNIIFQCFLLSHRAAKDVLKKYHISAKKNEIYNIQEGTIHTRKNDNNLYYSMAVPFLESLQVADLRVINFSLVMGDYHMSRSIFEEFNDFNHLVLEISEKTQVDLRKSLKKMADRQIILVTGTGNANPDSYDFNSIFNYYYVNSPYGLVIGGYTEKPVFSSNGSNIWISTDYITTAKFPHKDELANYTGVSCGTPQIGGMSMVAQQAFEALRQNNGKKLGLETLKDILYAASDDLSSKQNISDSYLAKHKFISKVDENNESYETVLNSLKRIYKPRKTNRLNTRNGESYFSEQTGFGYIPSYSYEGNKKGFDSVANLASSWPEEAVVDESKIITYTAKITLDDWKNGESIKLSPDILPDHLKRGVIRWVKGDITMSESTRMLSGLEIESPQGTKTFAIDYASSNQGLYDLVLPHSSEGDKKFYRHFKRNIIDKTKILPFSLSAFSGELMANNGASDWHVRPEFYYELSEIFPTSVTVNLTFGCDVETGLNNVYVVRTDPSFLESDQTILIHDYMNEGVDCINAADWAVNNQYARSASETIDLRPGARSVFTYHADNYSKRKKYLRIFYNNDIENAIGGPGKSIFYDNTLNNRLEGRLGDDSFHIISGGFDRIQGYLGEDQTIIDCKTAKGVIAIEDDNQKPGVININNLDLEKAGLIRFDNYIAIVSNVFVYDGDDDKQRHLSILFDLKTTKEVKFSDIDDSGTASVSHTLYSDGRILSASKQERVNQPKDLFINKFDKNLATYQGQIFGQTRDRFHKLSSFLTSK